MKDLSLRNLPKLAITEGASTPAAAGGALVESTTSNAILFWDVGSSTWKKLSSTSDSNNLPSGGAIGTFLKKNSATNFDAAWVQPIKSDVGLANVDNTSDANKPISSATQTALDAKLSSTAGSVTASKLDPFALGGNLFPDYGMMDASLYSGDAFALAGANVGFRGRQQLTFTSNAVLQEARTAWFPVIQGVPLDFSVSQVCGTADALTTVETLVELASMNASGVATLTNTTSIGTKTGSISHARQSATITPGTAERLARFVFRRAAGGTSNGTFGGPLCWPAFTPDNSVTNFKLADMATQTFKGRATAGSGDPEDLSVAQVKTALALDQVNNTSDASKPVSTAAQTALDGKQATLVSGTNIKTVNGTTILGSGDIVISGGGGGHSPIISWVI